MKVLDLFCGLKGWSRPFLDRGHEVFTTDIDAAFSPDLTIDFMELVYADLPWQPDVILASPPCEAFSTMTMGRNWEYDGRPKTSKAALAKALVEKTVRFCAHSGARYWVIENPRARLRTLPFAPSGDRRTVWYCRLGESVAKPTDLWGRFPERLRLPDGCKNGYPDHIAAPRGSQTGTQGVGRGVSGRRALVKAGRAKVPYGLALTYCLYAEEALGEF